MQAIDHAFAGLAQERGFLVVFDGNGGDNLFCFIHSAASVTDSLRVRVTGRGTIGTLIDMCRLTGADMGSMLRATCQRLLHPRAVAASLAAEIVVRTSKAGPDRFIRTIFKHHHARLQEMLLDGVPCSQGLISRRQTEVALRADPISGGSIIYRLLDLAEAEAWARQWAR